MNGNTASPRWSGHDGRSHSEVYRRKSEASCALRPLGDTQRSNPGPYVQTVRSWQLATKMCRSFSDLERQLLLEPAVRLSAKPPDSNAPQYWQLHVPINQRCHLAHFEGTIGRCRPVFINPTTKGANRWAKAKRQRLRKILAHLPRRKGCITQLNGVEMLSVTGAGMTRERSGKYSGRDFSTGVGTDLRLFLHSTR